MKGYNEYVLSSDMGITHLVSGEEVSFIITAKNVPIVLSQSQIIELHYQFAIMLMKCDRGDHLELVVVGDLDFYATRSSMRKILRSITSYGNTHRDVLGKLGGGLDLIYCSDHLTPSDEMDVEMMRGMGYLVSIANLSQVGIYAGVFGGLNTFIVWNNSTGRSLHYISKIKFGA